MTTIFEKLKVWQLSHKLALEVYRVTTGFPKEERYGLTSQLRRAAVAVPANIVEGNARNHRREYVQYCHIARASVAELKYLLMFSFELGLLEPQQYHSLYDGYNEVGKMLQGLITRLSQLGRNAVTNP